MLRCAAAGVRATAGGPSAAGMVMRPFSVMDKLRGMLGMSGAMDAGSAITDFQKLDPKAIKDEVQKMTLEAFVSTKRSALSGIKGKVLGMATNIDQNAMLAQVEKEEKIVNAMTAAEKNNAANMTSGQLLAISRRAGVDANTVSQLVQTFSMSRAQLLILADMKEQGLTIPSDPKDLQALLGQHAERMIREAQMRPIDRGPAKSYRFRR